MRAAGLASSLRLLLVDVACSVRLSEAATCVSQNFGVLTIEFSSCACVKRSADVICVVLVAADQQARLCKSVKKRCRLIKWKRCVLSFAFRDQLLAAMLAFQLLGSVLPRELSQEESVR
ncbi:hypothetical protein F511_23503 [Dorcoceras hygrometricum]|uniref:Secreted protein n=1 Tax=Dorcoceras hygrometricum TaxID=472368 RepID=A0A2Z7AEH7_9LAMI|nr:hypothetical protein F511_23503 [Dorcoceras hygrometricum]